MTPVITPFDADRSQQCEDGRRQDSQAERVLPPESLGQHSARQVGDHVAPVEGGQDKSLQLFVPFELARGQGVVHIVAGWTSFAQLHGAIAGRLLDHLCDGHGQTYSHSIRIHDG